jgi:hypothetical protein
MNRWIYKSLRIHWHAPPKCCQDLTLSHFSYSIAVY